MMTIKVRLRVHFRGMRELRLERRSWRELREGECLQSSLY